MTQSQTADIPATVAFSNHAIDRVIQRLPEIASEAELIAAFRRAEPVTARQLVAESLHCGRPVRVRKDSLYFRDPQTWALFCLRPSASTQWVVVTVIRFRRPVDFNPLEY